MAAVASRLRKHSDDIAHLSRSLIMSQQRLRERGSKSCNSITISGPAPSYPHQLGYLWAYRGL